MQTVTLIFPNTSSLASFIIKFHVERAVVNSREQTLTAPLTDENVMVAISKYEAELKTRLRH